MALADCRAVDPKVEFYFIVFEPLLNLSIWISKRPRDVYQLSVRIYPISMIGVYDHWEEPGGV